MQDIEFKSVRKGRYDNGYKYCRRCEAFYLTDSNRCPVCGRILRNKPRRSKRLNSKAVEITPEVEKELERIELDVKIIGSRKE